MAVQGPGSFRHAIDQLMTTALQRTESLTTADFSPLTVQQLEFFNRCYLLFQNFKYLYSGQMETALDKVDKTAKTALDTITTLMNQCTPQLPAPRMQQLTYQLKATLASVPGTPKLTAIFPVVVASSLRDFPVIIECVGNFLSFPNATPFLICNQKIFKPITTSQNITFSVPLTELFPPDQSSKIATFDVKFPYLVKSSILKICDKVFFRTIKGSIYLLPPSPGTITVKYTKIKGTPINIPLTSQDYIQNSRDPARGGAGKSLLDLPYTLQTKQGWTIASGSGQFISLESKGDKESDPKYKNTWKPGPATSTAITFLVSTKYYDPPQHCGKIRFRLSATLTRTATTTETTNEKVFLKWGDSVTLDPLKGSPEISLIAFDGTEQKLTGYSSAPFISLKPSNDGPVLSAETPELVSFHFHEQPYRENRSKL